MVEPKTFEERIQALHKERAAIEQAIKQTYLAEYEITRLDRARRAYDVLKQEGARIVKPGWMEE